MIRKLTGHYGNEVNDKLIIEVVDEPGSGGANHHYCISGFDVETNPSAVGLWDSGKFDNVDILFQNGTIPEKGVNGVTAEALLAIVQDRLEAFQAGPFACGENKEALFHVKQVLHWLHLRTKLRTRRGVEGQHVA